VRVVLYTGKGGVGKTTTAAATAVHAARRGARTLVASADAAHSLGDVLEMGLGAEPREVAPRLAALEVDVRAETDHHWGAIRDWLVSLFRYQGIEETVAEELALLPGAEELTTLLAVERHAREGGYDLIVVDCAPTDAALRLLTLPEVARGALRVLLRVQQALASVVTPMARSVLSVPLPESAVFRDAEALLYEKLQLLRQFVTAKQTSVRLVVTPERMVIDEALRAHTDLALFELPCDAVVMNRLLPEAATAEPFFEDWGRLQDERLAEVAEAFAPLAILRAPLQEDEVTGHDRLAHHGELLFAGHEPDAVLSRPRRVRFAKDGEGYRADVPLPHAALDRLDVAKLADELLITTGERRRALPLPRRIAALDLVGARLEGGVLVARFARGEVA
jgi:arsenite-transporting ATPase